MQLLDRLDRHRVGDLVTPLGECRLRRVAARAVGRRAEGELAPLKDHIERGRAVVAEEPHADCARDVDRAVPPPVGQRLLLGRALRVREGAVRHQLAVVEPPPRRGVVARAAKRHDEAQRVGEAAAAGGGRLVGGDRRRARRRGLLVALGVDAVALECLAPLEGVLQAAVAVRRQLKLPRRVGDLEDDRAARAAVGAARREQ